MPDNPATTTARKRIRISPRQKRIAAVLIALLAFGIAAYFGAKPAFRQFRHWRLAKNEATARQALAAGDFSQARDLSIAALRLGGDRYEMLKVLRDAMTKLGDPRAPYVARIIMEMPEHTDEDRRIGFKMICESLPTARVRDSWRRLTPEERRDTAFIAPFVERLIDQGFLGDANKILKDCYDIDARPALLLLRAKLRIASGVKNRKTYDLAQIDIIHIMDKGGPDALAAFRLLADIPWDRFHPFDFPDLDKWLEKQPDATVSDHLVARIQQFARYPLWAARIIDETTKKYATSHPVETARWLTGLDHPERALPLLPDDAKQCDVESFRARAEALAALKQWKELSDWLAHDPPPDFPALELHARRVIAAHKSGNTALRTREWETCLREAAALPKKNGFIELHQFMAKAGIEDLANEAMVAAVRLGRGRLPLFNQIGYLIPWLRTHRRGLALYDFARVMAALEPYNPLPAAIALDIGCTSGNIEPATAIEGLSQIRKQFPQIQGVDEALATAYILDNQPDKALETVPPSTAEHPDCSPHARAIVGIALAMKGEDEKARKILDEVPWDHMLTEECDAFSRALSHTRLGQSAEQEKIRKLAEAPAPPPNQKIIQDILEQEKKRRELIKEFQEKHQ